MLLLITSEHGITSVLPPQEGLEAVVRSKNGKDYIFVLNHNAKSVFITIPGSCKNLLTGVCYAGEQITEVEQNGVMILESVEGAF